LLVLWLSDKEKTIFHLNEVMVKQGFLFPDFWPSSQVPFLFYKKHFKRHYTVAAPASQLTDVMYFIKDKKICRCTRYATHPAPAKPRLLHPLRHTLHPLCHAPAPATPRPCTCYATPLHLLRHSFNGQPFVVEVE
jgi:hypothetical protein